MTWVDWAAIASSWLSFAVIVLGIFLFRRWFRQSKLDVQRDMDFVKGEVQKDVNHDWEKWLLKAQSEYPERIVRLERSMDIFSKMVRERVHMDECGRTVDSAYKLVDERGEQMVEYIHGLLEKRDESLEDRVRRIMEERDA